MVAEPDRRHDPAVEGHGQFDHRKLPVLFKLRNQSSRKSTAFKIIDDADKVALFGVIQKHQRERVILAARLMAGIADHFQADHTVNFFFLSARHFGIHPAAHMRGSVDRRLFQRKENKFYRQIKRI